MTTIQSIKAYAPAFKGSDKTKQNIVKTPKEYTPKQNRKRWGITAGITGALGTAFYFLAPVAKRTMPLAGKIVGSLVAVVGTGTMAHFLLTKNSKLNNDKLTDSFGKRLGIVSGITAATIPVSFAVNNVAKGIGKSVYSKGSVAKMAILSFANVVLGYSILEGIKSLIDKSGKKEKQAEQVQQAVEEAIEAKEV